MSNRSVLSDVQLLRRLLAEARPEWPGIVSVGLVGLLATPLALLTPLPLKLAVDSVLGDLPIPAFLGMLLPTAATRDDTSLLLVAVGMLVVVTALTQAQDAASNVLRTAVGERMLLRFRGRLFDRAQHLSLLHHDRVGTTDTTYRIEFDARSLQYVALESVVPTLTAAATLVGMFVVMVRIDGALALVALAISPVLVLSSHTFRGRLRSRSRRVKQLEARALSLVQEVLTSIRVVKVFLQEHREQDRFLRRSGDAMRARMGLVYEESAYSATVGMTMALGSAIVLLVGVRHVQRGVLTLGDLLLVLGYLAQFYSPLKTMAKKAGQLQSHLASAERAFALLDEPLEVPEPAHGRPLDRARGAIEFRSVSFGYDPDRPILHDVSFRLEPGTRLGIAGRTGAGKTTLIGMLIRLFDPDAGRIMLDGVDLREHRLADLRRQFGVVLQEPTLLSRTIAENIAYARPDATEREIVAAARQANAHGFISRLPEGYATTVGERGMSLSGGERQRIALARAFLKDAPILILDEPTSAVDVETEASIMEALERLMAGRTTLVIAHRLGTLDRCDLVLRIDEDRIAEVRAPDGRGAPPARAAARGRMLEDADAPSHPAVRAWRRVVPDRAPLRVEVLKERSGVMRKSAVYRLLGTEGWSVIAKRSPRDTAAVESVIYRDILPHLGVPFPHWYGDVDDGGLFTWLFIDEAAGERYGTDGRHPVIAGDWLGRIHAAARRHHATTTLPDRGTTHFLRHLHDARSRLEAAARWAPDRHQAQVMRHVAHTLDVVEDRWGLVVGACDAMPRTLVHGDLVRKSLRLVEAKGQVTVVAYDWEEAGYGPSAVDLAQVQGFPRFTISVDLEAYRRAAADGGMPVSTENLSRASSAGVVLRCVAAIDWSSASLARTWIDRPLADVAVYEPWLAQAMRDLDRAVPVPGGRR